MRVPGLAAAFVVASGATGVRRALRRRARDGAAFTAAEVRDLAAVLAAGAGPGGVELRLDGGGRSAALSPAPTGGPALDRLGLADGGLDDVEVAAGVLERAPDMYAGLCAIRRVLRDGGQARLHVANAAALPRPALLRRPVDALVGLSPAGRRGPVARPLTAREDGLTVACVRPTATELRDLCVDAGFDVVAVGSYDGDGRSRRGLLGSTLSLEAVAARAPLPRPSRPWWPAHAGGDLPLDYLTARPDVVALVPATATAVLDVGCAAGSLGMVLRARGARVDGIEADPRLAALAAEVLDGVATGDALEVLVSGRGLDPAGYDCVVLADCLEHMPDPAAVLTAARDRLLPGGSVVVSVPNARHWEALWSLAVRGRWPAREAGIFDRTHLRWFTRRTLAELLTACGFSVETTARTARVVESRPGRLDGVAARLPGAPGELVAFQWLARARRTEG